MGSAIETQRFDVQPRLTIRGRSGKLKSVDTFWQLLLVAPGDPSEKPTDSTVPRFPYSDATFPESHQSRNTCLTTFWA